MPLRRNRFRIGGGLIASVLVFTALSLTPADAWAGGGGSTTRWVAKPPETVGGNTSCSDPGYVATGGDPAAEAIVSAIDDAAPGDTIHICAGTWLTDGYSFMSYNPLTIQGDDSDETIIDSNQTTYLFRFPDGDPAVFADLTIQGALAEADGSAIWATGDLTIEDSALLANGGSVAGGVFSGGDVTVRRSLFEGRDDEFAAPLLNSTGEVTVEDSTFANNIGVPYGGVLVEGNQDPREVTVDSSTFSGLSATCISALGAFGNVQTTITNSTFTGNQAGDGNCPSAHVFSGGAPLVMRSSTFAGNTGVRATALGDSGELIGIGGLTLGNNVIVGDPDAGLTCERNLPGVFTNEGGNVISDGTNGCDDFVGGPAPSLQAKVSESSIALDPLALNAPGTTETMALGASSVARGAAIAGDCPATDQRGVARPANDCDAGAYQYASSGKPKLKVTIGTPRKARAGKNFGITVRTRNVAPAPATRASSTRSGNTAQSVKTCAKLPKGIFVVKANGGKVKGRTICWTRSSLPAGKSVTYRATVRSSKTRSGSLRVSGTVSASNDSGATVKASGSSKVRIVKPKAPKPKPPTG